LLSILGDQPIVRAWSQRRQPPPAPTGSAMFAALRQHPIHPTRAMRSADTPKEQARPCLDVNGRARPWSSPRTPRSNCMLALRATAPGSLTDAAALARGTRRCTRETHPTHPQHRNSFRSLSPGRLSPWLRVNHTRTNDNIRNSLLPARTVTKFPQTSRHALLSPNPEPPPAPTRRWAALHAGSARPTTADVRAPGIAGAASSAIRIARNLVA